MQGNNPNKAKNTTIKIIVPILLLCFVAAIWFVKNFQEEVVSAGSTNLDFALHVTKEIDLEKLKSYGLPIVIDFGADTCIPCKEMAPVLKQLNEELQGRAIVKFVDVWKYQPLAEGYPINLIPTQIFIDANGKPYTPQQPEAKQMTLFSSKEIGEHIFTTHEGGMTKEQLLEALKEMGLK